MNNGMNRTTALHLAECLAARDKLISLDQGPKIGDYIYLKNGSLRRFTHDWGDSLQVTCENSGDTSFSLGSSGYISFSGSLDPSIQKEKIKHCYTKMPGRVWVWLDGRSGADRAVYCNIECRVFREE